MQSDTETGTDTVGVSLQEMQLLDILTAALGETPTGNKHKLSQSAHGVVPNGGYPL